MGREEWEVVITAIVITAFAFLWTYFYETEEQTQDTYEKSFYQEPVRK